MNADRPTWQERFSAAIPITALSILTFPHCYWLYLDFHLHLLPDYLWPRATGQVNPGKLVLPLEGFKDLGCHAEYHHSVCRADGGCCGDLCLGRLCLITAQFPGPQGIPGYDADPSLLPCGDVADRHLFCFALDHPDSYSGQ